MIDLDPQNTLLLHIGVPLRDGVGFGSGSAQQVPPPWQACLQQPPWGIRLLSFRQTNAEGALTISDASATAPDRLGAMLEALLAYRRGIVLINSPPGSPAAMAAALPFVAMLNCVLLVNWISTALISDIDACRAVGPGTDVGKASTLTC